MLSREMEVASTSDPHAKLVRYVQQIAEVAHRITTMVDMLRATAPAQPDVAAFLEHLERGRREGALQLLGHGVPPGTWQNGMTPERVADITFAIASPDTLRALTERCGWSPHAAQTLVVTALADAMLPNSQPTTR